MQAAKAVGDHGKCLDLEMLKKKFLEENKMIDLEGFYTVIDAEGKSMKLVAPEDFNPKFKIGYRIDEEVEEIKPEKIGAELGDLGIKNQQYAVAVADMESQLRPQIDMFK